MRRTEWLGRLADCIAAVDRTHPVRAAIDGIDASGKTFLADELADSVRERGREVIRASIDSFHNPGRVRYRRGQASPVGYYEDSFNHGAIISHLLEPLGPGGSLMYKTAVFDFQKDAAVKAPALIASKHAVLLFDGIFLHRPELADYWDFTVFLEISFEASLSRALERDGYLFGRQEKIRQAYEKKYIPGQMIYLETVRPFDLADILVDNNDFENPMIRLNE